MGDSQNAAAALVDHPRWVALHRNTLAKLDVLLSAGRAEGAFAQDDYDLIIRDLDHARRDADRAQGIDMDRAETPGSDR